MESNFYLDFKAIPECEISSDQIDRINESIEELTSRKLESIELQEESTKFRPTNMIRVINQSFIRRGLHLYLSGKTLLDANFSLGPLILGRCIIETVASYRDFQKKIIELIDNCETEDDLQGVLDFVRSRGFATRLDHLIEQTGDEEARARNILGQIDKMANDRKSLRNDYDYLSEFSHPNSFGTLNFYAELDREKDAYFFKEEGLDFAGNYYFFLVCVHTLEYFVQYLQAVEDKLGTLSKLGEDMAKGELKK